MTIAEAIRIIDLLGTFAFAANGAYAAVRAAKVDIVGLIVLGSVTAVGGGMIRDVLLDVPPVALTTWVYPTVALVGSLVPLVLRRPRRLLGRTIGMLDTIGLSLFCVVGAQKALEHGLGPVPAIWLGVVTCIGGGILRDVMTKRVPAVLKEGFYAVPAAAGAAVVAVAPLLGTPAGVAMATGAAACFLLRLLGVTLKVNLPPTHQLPAPAASASPTSEPAIEPPSSGATDAKAGTTTHEADQT